MRLSTTESYFLYTLHFIPYYQTTLKSCKRKALLNWGLLICLAILGLGALSSEVKAEGRTIYGLTFDIGTTSTDKNGVVTADLFGESIVVLEKDLEEQIIAAYFDGEALARTKARAASFPLNRLENFIIEALQAENFKIASFGIFALTLHPEATLDSVHSLIKEIDKIPDSHQALSEYVLLTKGIPLSNPTEFPIVVSATKVEPPLAVLKSYPIDVEQKKIFTNYIERSFINSLLDEDLSSADGLLEAYAPLYMQEKNLLEKLQKLSKLIPPIVAAFKKGHNSEFLSLKELSSGEPHIEENLSSSLADFVLNQAEKFIKSNNSSYALWLLSKIDAKYRTLKSHEFTVKALEGLGDNKEKGLLASGVTNYLQESSKSSAIVKSKYIEVLELRIDELLAINKPERVLIFLGILSSVNPDPNEENDKTRIKWAWHYIKDNKNETGISILEDLRGGLSFNSRIFYKAYTIWLKYTFLVIIGGIITVLLMLLMSIRFVNKSGILNTLSRPQKKRHETETSSSSDEQEFMDDEEMPLFVKGGAATHLSPIAHEYLSLLNLFDLPPNTPLVKIKQIYRDKLKQLHPDLKNSSQNGENTLELMKIRTAYERICEIEKEELLTDEEKHMLRKRSDLQTTW
jgi:hypothetical protein